MRKKKPSARRVTKVTPRAGGRSRRDWTGWFLACLAQLPNIRAACQVAKVSRQTVYKRRDKDEAFREALADALEDGCDVLEAELWRRAKDGVEEPVLFMGKPVFVWVDPATRVIVPEGTAGATQTVLAKKTFSDAGAIFLLKAHRYRDQLRLEHTGPGGGPMATRHDHTVEVEPDVERIATILGILADSGALDPATAAGGDLAGADAE